MVDTLPVTVVSFTGIERFVVRYFVPTMTPWRVASAPVKVLPCTTVPSSSMRTPYSTPLNVLLRIVLLRA